jgi:hypothetical protein
MVPALVLLLIAAVGIYLFITERNQVKTSKPTKKVASKSASTKALATRQTTTKAKATSKTPASRKRK